MSPRNKPDINSAYRELDAQFYNDATAKIREMWSDRTTITRNLGGDGGDTDNLTPSGDLPSLKFNAQLSSSGDTLTLTPVESGMGPLYGDDGVGWNIHPIVAPVTLNTAGSTTGKLYDIYGNWDQTLDDPTVSLSAVAWTNETTRSVAIVYQDGVALKSTDTHFRLLAVCRYNGATMLVPKYDPNGELIFGTGDPRNNVADPHSGVGMSAGGVTFGSFIWNFWAALNGVVGVGFNAVGQFLAMAGGLIIDASGFFLKLVGGATYISFTSTRALFGSDISSANTTALAIFFTAQTYNSESMVAGAVMIGSNSANYANVLWNPSTKIMYFRSGTTVQAYVDTTGAVTAGGGVALVDSNGFTINLSTSFSALRAYKFRDAALNYVAGLYANSSLSKVTQFLIVDGSLPTKDAELDIQSVTTTGKQAAIVMQALNGVHNANLSLNTSAGVGGGATLSGDVRTLLTAPLNGVGPSTFAPAFVWDIQGTLNTTGAATLGSTLVVAGAISGSNLSNTNSGDQTLKTPLGGNGLAGTVALSSTMYVAPYYPAVPSASEANVQFPVPFTGSLKNMRFRLTGTQPATGTLVITLRIAATNTTITITIAAGATAGTYSDLTHTEDVTAGQLISISCVNNALGVSGTIGAFSLEYDAA